MRIDFEATGATLSPDQLEQLSRIIYLIEDGWHSWAGPDPEHESLEPYYSSHERHRELLSKSYTQSLAYPQSTHQSIVITNADVDEGAAYSFERAYTFLNQCLDILVENQRNDGRFFEHVLGPIDPELVSLFHTQRPPLRWQHGGGKDEIFKLLEDRIKDFTDRSVRPRLLVIVDSDSRWPGHVAAGNERLSRLCSDASIELWILHKRSIENYVPDRAIRQYADDESELRARAEAILRLTPTQRDHFPVKSGLAADLHADEKVLYADIVGSPAAKAALPNVVAYFIRHFAACSTEDLHKRGCLSEFVTLVELIRGEL